MMDGSGNVNGVGPSHVQINRPRPVEAERTTPTRRRNDQGDRIELSPGAQRASSDNAQTRIAGVRQQIADGTYETDAKISATVERLFATLAAVDLHA